jgi:DNA-binding transcriptional MerR regulator
MAGSAAAPQTTTEKDYYRIGEVSRMTDLKPFVLRYWETEFPMLEPVKSASGHRLYRAADVEMVRQIKRLLYDEGFTIAGARRHLRDPHVVLESRGAPAEFQLTSPDVRDPESRIEQRGGMRGEGGELAAHPNPAQPHPAQLLNRKMLLDLRDSLRAFLTLLERR